MVSYTGTYRIHTSIGRLRAGMCPRPDLYDAPARLKKTFVFLMD